MCKTGEMSKRILNKYLMIWAINFNGEVCSRTIRKQPFANIQFVFLSFKIENGPAFFFFLMMFYC